MAASSPTIRPGVPADFGAIDAFDPFAGDRRSELAEGRCLVAVCVGQVVGYVSFSAAGFIGRPFVHFLAVAPDHCRRGIASALLIAVARQVGEQRLFISTEADNQPMLALLAKHQWTAAGSVEGVNISGVPEQFFYRDAV